MHLVWFLLGRLFAIALVLAAFIYFAGSAAS